MQTQAATQDAPWLSEPDRHDFEASGLPCTARRGPMGAWCAYIGVRDDHPWHGKSYNDSVTAPEGRSLDDTKINEIGVINLFCANPAEIEEGILDIVLLVRCHGGLTYSEDHPGGKEPDDRATWWFGFDCAHSGDLSPKMRLHGGEEYRALPYVIECCEKAAADLAGAR